MDRRILKFYQLSDADPFVCTPNFEEVYPTMKGRYALVLDEDPRLDLYIEMLLAEALRILSPPMQIRLWNHPNRAAKK